MLCNDLDFQAGNFSVKVLPSSIKNTHRCQRGGQSMALCVASGELKNQKDFFLLDLV